MFLIRRLAPVLSALILMVPSAVAGELRVHVSDEQGNPLEYAVIEVISPQIPIPDDWDYSGVMDQVDKEFVENVITVVEGSLVSFPNNDDIHHHVYSFSENKTFELPLYIGDVAEPVLFDQAGVAVVGCNIHDWMQGFIYVGKSHLMARSDEGGLATLTGLEAGTYTFSVWHERLPGDAPLKEVTAEVDENGVTGIRVSLELGRDNRIRRAPGGIQGGYQ